VRKLIWMVAEPMIPFYAAGLIVLYGINAGANAMMNCESRDILRFEDSLPADLFAAEEFKNDPRNPNAKVDAKPAH